MGSVQGVLSLGEDRSGRGFRRSSSESGHRGRWSHGGDRAVAGLSGRVAAKLCPLASARRKMTLSPWGPLAETER